MRGRLRSVCAAALLLALPVGAAPQDLPPALAERFSQGVAALTSGQLAAAEAAFRAVIRAGGDRAFVRHNLGIVLQRQGRHRDAVAEFRAAVRLDPGFGPARLLAGTSLLALGDVPGATAQLERAVALMPDEPAARLQLAGACERAGDAMCLVDQYRALAAMDGANAEYAYRLGKAYLRLSEWAHARLQGVEPRSARLSQALGREYLEQRRPDLAEAAFLEALGRDPSLAEVRLELARIYLADRRWDDAAREVAAVLAAAPEHRAANRLRAAIESARPR